MRYAILVGLVTGIIVACSSSEPLGNAGWHCNYPDAGGANEICHCFDGDVRCNRSCPMDLTLACMPGDGCGDLSGGSAGGDCDCTCDAMGHWSCTGPQGACIPM